MADMKIVFPGGKRVDAEYKGFTIKTDQSELGGGEGSAPAPFDLFLTSIGTCAGIYVLSFCQKRSIDASDVRLTMKTERDAETHMISKIVITIEVPEGFPEKYHSAVIRAADMCTVKKHLDKDVAVDISVETPTKE